MAVYKLDKGICALSSAGALKVSSREDPLSNVSAGLSIHSTFRLHSLRTVDSYNERSNLCGREMDMYTHSPKNTFELQATR